jgi:uncharacterized NAD-dependent epimerase/dehydratase family protein
MINSFNIPFPYLLFTGDASSAQTTGKTAAGVAHWSKKKCLGQLWLEETRLDLGLPHLRLQEAVEKGARTLIIGVSALGGKLEEKWIALFVEALKAGLNLAAGLHTRLSDVPQIREAAKKYHRDLFDVRYYDGPIPSSQAAKRTGKRLLTVGTDCAVGKMYAALAITEALKEKNIDATFRATGQTGILIAGSGIAIDDLAADFLFNAIELLSPNASANHWDVIEGQGALFHPQSAGGSLFLVHGSQPDVMVLCHNPARKAMADFPNYPIPDLSKYIHAYEEAARLTNPHAKVEGISLNTSQFKEKEKKIELIQSHEQKYGLPCFDPVFTGVHLFVETLILRHRA